jgi:hypothetical protein
MTDPALVHWRKVPERRTVMCPKHCYEAR